MKVAIISKSTAEGGGASRIAQDLAFSMGEHVPHFSAVHWRGWGSLAPGDAAKPLYGAKPLMRKSIKACRIASGKLGLQEALPFEWLAMRNSELMEADLIHIHDTTVTLSPLSLRWLARRKLVLWSFHDTSPFTGGCINPLDCTQYLASCQNCPQSKSWPICGLSPTPGLQLSLKRQLGRERLWVSTPSSWLAGLVAKSGCYPMTRPHVISNGIDTSLFRPGDKRALRSQLGLAPDVLTIVISAGHLTDARKGIPDALSVIRRIAAEVPVQVIAVGRENPALAAALAGIRLVTTGYLTSMPILSAAYAAADALVYCSYADNQPLTILENLAVGNAVYAYATGGIPEIADGRTGSVVAQGAAETLASQLVSDWRENRFPAFSEAARARAVREFSLERMVRNFADLYTDILHGRVR